MNAQLLAGGFSAAETMSSVDVTVVVPVRDEESNVAAVCSELQQVMDGEPLLYEVIIVNDGSADRTAQELQQTISTDPRFTVIEFTRGFGQSAALAAGFQAARGQVIVPMDGDRQSDPRDIPGLVAALHDGPGYDVVSGWRRDRHDSWWSRRLPSRAANWLIRGLTRCPEVHDFGCTLKAYRQEVLSTVKLYGEMHRFLPALCRWEGARLTERVVNHRPRVAGASKYGLRRTVKVLLDLITVKFLGDYLTKPLYFFGKLAVLTLTIGVLLLAMAIVQKLGYLTEHGEAVMLNNNVFLLLALMALPMTLMWLMMGVISELLIRIYHESQARPPYRIRSVMRARAGASINAPGSPATLVSVRR